MSGLLLSLLALLLFLALLLSCVFSGGETAITVVNPAKLIQLKGKNDRRVTLLLDLHNDKERVISTILLCNNVVNILASSISAFFVVNFFGSIGILVSTCVMSVIIVIFGEIFPKTYAINHPETLGMYLAPFMVILVRLFGSLVKYVNLVVGVLVKWFAPSSDSTKVFSPYDAIRGLIMLHKKSYVQQNTQKNLEVINNMLDLTELHVDKIMTHRKDVYSLNINLPKDELIQLVLGTTYRWIPLWEERDDNFVKVLNAVQLRIACANDQDIKMKDYLTEPSFIPETTLVSVQLHNFKVNKADFSIVIDEYGNAIGIVTFFDIIEEIIGEAVYTHNYKDIKDSGDNGYIINGRIPIRDLNKKMGFNFPTDHNRTFAGMIIDEIERIPNEGEVFEMFGCTLEILKMRNNKLVSVKVKRIKEGTGDEGLHTSAG
ncbi:HlyC/CorC family transporter [Neorickettsia sennetsu]|uniref:CBS domain protein n=1 Tax=Ehrlichia sennetsu (strain ATCC VR-367 / Miyayama) TaxID=222891 RepID=Q2GE05_EHRS3|nr:CNNM domain-containing protein [Neorickettsia sennetsu]ABD46497.1 CBS domain protein [Neorickettsia sennetsu str. Miyayama]